MAYSNSAGDENSCDINSQSCRLEAITENNDHSVTEAFLASPTRKTQYDLSAMRQDYGKHDDPFVHHPSHWYDLFAQWFAEAQNSAQAEPNAMVIASVNMLGRPRTRTVLAKEVNELGVLFYSNYDSVKGQNFSANPYAAATFLWLALHRQVQFSGKISPVSAEISDAYWHSRPRSSQIGAWVSRQSQTIADPQTLAVTYDQCERDFAGHKTIPRPEFWGGYILVPDRVEFWAGKTSRLHDRLEFYLPSGIGSDVQITNQWLSRRLQP